MASSGVQVADECVTAYNELKMGKGSLKYIVFKISDNGQEIVVENKSNEQDWDTFRQELINSKSKDRRGKEGQGARYAVYDFVHTTSEGIESQKVGIISWIPDDAGVFTKMTYAGSKEALKRSLSGLAADVQASDTADLEYDSIIPKIFKKL